MSKRLFIDTAHKEEIRVALADEDKLERFDFEITSKTQIRGNIYLAKVIRVEPSLQAAFVDYGGGRHGFLGFSEIHHDYYQIPINDRETIGALEANDVEQQTSNDNDIELQDEDTIVDELQLPKAKNLFYKKYKIQEVIKKRQVMLVQVQKEERGNKGAALTTFVSLAGRYCVLMPNTDRPCGISKKISAPNERKKMKQILASLDVPRGMCVVIRTAGVNHTKQEIKKDFEYVLKIWDEIRSTTLSSQAPSLIHEEANIIKRTIRDLYSKDIDEIIVDGEEGYKIAKNVMKKMLPTHVKKIKQHTDTTTTLFSKYGLDDKIKSMYSTKVNLPSGGYLVITPTEAMVSIDVNSGKSTKDRTVSATALRTNLEAATEVARQCKLRDLGGVIVVDFIDMEEKNNILVEKTIKDEFADDRAKVQVSRISMFGLLEISRQRIHPNLIEMHRVQCPHCNGEGTIWSQDSIFVQVLRKIDETLTAPNIKEITISMSQETALFFINEKKEYLSNVEREKNCKVKLAIDNSLSVSAFNLSITQQKKANVEDSDAEQEEHNVRNEHELEKQKKRERKNYNKDNKQQLTRRRTRKNISNVQDKAIQEIEQVEATKQCTADQTNNVPYEKADSFAQGDDKQNAKIKPHEDLFNTSSITGLSVMDNKGLIEKNYSDLMQKAIFVREEIEKNSKEIDIDALTSNKDLSILTPPKKAKKGWWNKLMNN